MIFITVNQRGYSDTTLHGPFTSVEEGKEKVTDGVDRGHDGDETTYTFFEMTPDGMKEIGYIRFNDECEVRTQDIREEYFPLQQP
jgi:predicted dithiol-disulfide oxidoreductase (DUF899 family)